MYVRIAMRSGSLIAFEVHGGEAEAFTVLNNLRLIKLAVSLGGTESLAEHPATMTHADVDPETKVRLGISESLIRLSVGVENPEDIVGDLEAALEAEVPARGVPQNEAEGSEDDDAGAEPALSGSASSKRASMW